MIECAQDGTSPLHNAFTWDDAKAAHAYRLRQAQNLIAAVVIVDDQTGESTKAFWSISVKAEDNEEQRQGRYYQSVRVLKESPQEYASALKMALMELESSEITLQQLKRIAPDKEHVKIDKAAAHILDAHDLLYQSPSIGATV